MSAATPSAVHPQLVAQLQNMCIIQEDEGLGQDKDRSSSGLLLVDPHPSSTGDMPSDHSLGSDQSLHTESSAGGQHGASHMSSSSAGVVPEDLSRSSQDGMQVKNQICYDYTKGLCTRGDKCKYSHDLATIVHYNSKEKGICFDYLRNQCHRGLLCRFSHDLSNIAQQCQAGDAYSNNAQVKGKTNAICYDFVKGVCQRGGDCRYSHDLSLIARTSRGGQQTQKTAGEICYDFLRGRCNRGNSCKYSHNTSALANAGFLAMSPMGGSTSGAMPDGGGGAALVTSPSGGAQGLGSGMLPHQAVGGMAAAAGPASMLTLPTGMHGLPPLPPRLSSSAVQLEGAAAGQQAATPMGSMQAMLANTLSERDGLRASLSSELSETMQSGGHADPASVPPVLWHGRPSSVPNTHDAMAAAQMQAGLLAQHQRFAAAAAAVNQLRGSQSGGQQPNMQTSPTSNLTAASSFAAAAQQLAAVQQQQQAAARAMLHQQQQQEAAGAPAVPALGRSASLPGAITPESLTALLSNFSDNPQLLAEALTNLAAAQGLRLPNMSPTNAGAQQPGGGGVHYDHGAIPQAMMNAYADSHSGYLAPPAGIAGGPSALVTANSMPAPDMRARQQQQQQQAGPHNLANMNAAAVASDLLPLLKEIWKK